MHKIPKKAFTLVELIVVITILAILGTIAFISLQGYSKTARDTTRISDIQNIKKALELFTVKVGRYPDPTEAQPVTFSGGLAWYQGTFGDSTFRNVEIMQELPNDPLTGLEYTYSLLNTQREYEIAGIMESDDIAVMSPTYAAENTAKAIVTGTYNSLALRVNLATTSYILAVPSLITSIDLSIENNRKLETIIPLKQMVLKNQKNLPSNYRETNYNSEEELTNIDFEIVKDNLLSNIVIYEGNVDDLEADVLVEKLQTAYAGTTVEAIQATNAFKTLDTQDIDQSEKIDDFGVNFINYYLGGAAVTRIYNTCDSLAHNTTKSFYTGTGVTFTEGTCDSLKQDFTCKDGIFKDGDTTLDTNIYPYDTCSVADARTCTALDTTINHDDNLVVYSEDSIVWDASYNCNDRMGSITCNDSVLGGDIGFGYKTCAKGTPSNCIADPSYSFNGHIYNVIQLNHGVSSQPIDDISENNGTYRYTLDVICNDGNLSPTETGPVLQVCDTNYTVEGESCKSYCAAGEFDSYFYANIVHNQTEDVAKDTSPLNGLQQTTATLTCTDGVISKSNEVAGTITCHTSYYLNGPTCNLQWSGDATTGYAFKNTSGTEQYPLSCSDLLDQTTWKNTLNGSPWNGSKFNDGVYYIKPDTNPAFKVYCDMTSEGGGWMRYTDIKGNYTLTDALDCFKGTNISNSELECFNPNRYGIAANELKVKIGGNDYNSEIYLTPSYSTDVVYGGRGCTGQGDYMNIMVSGPPPGPNPTTATHIRLGHSYCKKARSVGGSYSSGYMNYDNSGNYGPLRGNRETTAVSSEFFIRNTNTTKALELYDGGYRWNTGTYPNNCKEYIDSTYYNNEGDGTYWIKPNTNPAFKVYCEMTTDGGGRTSFTDRDTSSYYVYDLGYLTSNFTELFYSYKRGGVENYAFKFNNFWTKQCGVEHGDISNVNLGLKDYVDHIENNSWGTCDRITTELDANDIKVEKIISAKFSNDACLTGTLHKTDARNYAWLSTITTDGKTVGDHQHRISDITVLFGPKGYGTARCDGATTGPAASEVYMFLR